MTKHIKVKISGRVQGIGFRFSAYEKFVELGLIGRAENTPDGGLLVDAEGPEERLPALVDWCRQGPVGARVENVEVTDVAEPFVPLKTS